MSLLRKLVACLAVASFVLLTGCPDYSHLREVPDYSSQRDSHQGDTSNTKKTVDPEDEAVEEVELDEEGREIE